MGEKKDEVWQLCARTDKPEEEYVTVTLPKSSYEAFHCMLDYPITGWHERDEMAMGRAEWNKDLYPLPADYRRREDVPHGRIVGHTMEDCLFYPGVKHKYWVYTPAQYDSSTSSCFWMGRCTCARPVRSPSARRTASASP